MDHCEPKLDFYEFCFPDVSKPTHSDYQAIFNEYGHMEAIDVIYDEVKQQMKFYSKKQKASYPNDNDDIVSSWMFHPRHPVLPLGDPPPISKLLQLPTVKEMCSKIVTAAAKGKRSGVPLDASNIRDQIENLLSDHPDAAQGTFLEMFSQYFPFKDNFPGCDETFSMEPGLEACKDLEIFPQKFLPGRRGFGSMRRFPSEFDPFMFDVPLPLLNDLLLEEMNTETKKLFFDSSTSGGSLCYKHLNTRKDFDYGLLVRAAGPAMDELSLQLLCTDTCDTYTDEEDFLPRLHLGSDYRISLNGRILEIDIQCSSAEESQFFAGTRSQHHALLTLIDGSEVKLNVNDDGSYSGLTYASASSVKPMSVLQSPYVISSMSVSPYIDGECLVATDDGKSYLWKAALSSDVDLTKVCAKDSGLQVIFKEEQLDCEEDRWRQVEFAAHPRQVLMADQRKVHLVDLRQKSNSARTIFVPSPAQPQDRVTSVLSGTKFHRSNEFQCIVATPYNLVLMDIRHPKVPLLRWSLNMRSPCQQLTCIGTSVDPVSCSVSSMVLAANQTPQEVHMYQFNSRSRPTNPVFQTSSRQESLLPPIALAAPLSVGSLKDIRRSVMQHTLPDWGYVSDRLSYPVVGLAGYDFKTSGGKNGIVALQLSGCGDLLHQSFDLQDPKVVSDEANIISGNIHDHSKYFKDKEERQQLRADELYQEWVDAASSDYKEAISQEDPFNLRCTRTSQGVFKFSLNKQFSEDMQQFYTRPSTNCAMCTNTFLRNEGNGLEDVPLGLEAQADPHSEDETLPNAQARHVGAESNESDVCFSCNLHIGNTDAMLSNRKSDVFHPANQLYDDEETMLAEDVEITSSYQRPPVENLELIEPDVSKFGLGRVLVSTWDISYEELWCALKDDVYSDEKEKKKKEMEKVYDLAPRNSGLSINNSEFSSSKVEVSNSTESEEDRIILKEHFLEHGQSKVNTKKPLQKPKRPKKGSRKAINSSELSSSKVEVSSSTESEEDRVILKEHFLEHGQSKVNTKKPSQKPKRPKKGSRKAINSSELSSSKVEVSSSTESEEDRVILKEHFLEHGQSKVNTKKPSQKPKRPKKGSRKAINSSELSSSKVEVSSSTESEEDRVILKEHFLEHGQSKVNTKKPSRKPKRPKKGSRKAKKKKKKKKKHRNAKASSYGDVSDSGNFVKDSSRTKSSNLLSVEENSRQKKKIKLEETFEETVSLASFLSAPPATTIRHKTNEQQTRTFSLQAHSTPQTSQATIINPSSNSLSPINQENKTSTFSSPSVSASTLSKSLAITSKPSKKLIKRRLTGFL